MQKTKISTIERGEKYIYMYKFCTYICTNGTLTTANKSQSLYVLFSHYMYISCMYFSLRSVNRDFCGVSTIGRQTARERKKICIGISTILFPPPPCCALSHPHHGHLSPDNPPYEIGSPSVSSCPIGTGQVAKPIYSPQRTRRSPDKRRRRTGAPSK